MCWLKQGNDRAGGKVEWGVDRCEARQISSGKGVDWKVVGDTEI